jgi:integrase
MMGEYLKPLDFTIYLDAFRNGERGSTQANHDVRLVSTMFSWAIARGYTLFNPVSGALYVSEKVRKVRLDDATREKIRAKVRPALALMIELAALTGMRKTDLRFLTCQQVVDGEIRVGQHKTGTAQDWEITPAVQAVLDAAAKLPGPDCSMYVFPNRRGQPYTESALQTLWYRARKAAGVSGYQFRDIRKRAINEARERGDATAFAGHKDPRTTHRNYFTEAAKVKPLR